MTKQTILIAGGTGLIGTRLTNHFRAAGHTIRILSRKPKGADQFAWDLAAKEIDEAAVAGADVVINLTGAGIADKRWTPARKRLIIDSRVESAQLLLDTFQGLNHWPKTYLSAGGVGYYGNSGDDWMNENDAPVDNSFLVETCMAWELEAEKIGAAGVRTVVLRTGIVLDPLGGALRELLKTLRFGFGTYFGDGQAWYSWIHPHDLCHMLEWAAKTPTVEGIYNAVAPHPARNIDLVKAIAAARNQTAIFAPVPEFGLRLLFGEMADAILFSTRASAEKVIKAGFDFHYPKLDMALTNLFEK